MKVLSILGLIFMVIGIGFVAILKSKTAWFVVAYGFVLWILNIRSDNFTVFEESKKDDFYSNNDVDYGDSTD